MAKHVKELRIICNPGIINSNQYKAVIHVHHKGEKPVIYHEAGVKEGNLNELHLQCLSGDHENRVVEKSYERTVEIVKKNDQGIKNEDLVNYLNIDRLNSTTIVFCMHGVNGRMKVKIQLNNKVLWLVKTRAHFSFVKVSVIHVRKVGLSTT